MITRTWSWIKIREWEFPLLPLLRSCTLIFFLLLSWWGWPYLPPLFLLLLLLLLFIEEKSAFRFRLSSWVKGQFAAGKIYLYLYLYWLGNLFFVARPPLALLGQTNFWTTDAKIFSAYLPFLLALFPLQTLQKYKKQFLDFFLAAATFWAGIGIIQYLTEIKIPFLGQRQQLILLVHKGALIHKLFIGGFLSHNAAAAFYLLPFFLLLNRANQAREKKEKILAAAATLIVLLALIFSFSRSGLQGLIIGLLLWLIFRSRVEEKLSRRRFLALFFSFLIAVPLFLFTLQHLSPRWARKIERLTNFSGYNVQTRLRLWNRAINYSLQSPLNGIGISRFNDQNFSLHFFLPPLPFLYSQGGKRIINEAHAHNSYLHLLAESGIIGSALFLTFWLALILQLWQNYQQNGAEIILALLTALGGLFSSAFFENTLASPSVIFAYLTLIVFYGLNNAPLTTKN